MSCRYLDMSCYSRRSHFTYFCYLLAHHALVDGIHLSQFYQNLDSALARLSAEVQ